VDADLEEVDELDDFNGDDNTPYVIGEQRALLA
jgi:hypothetical protein